MSADRQLRNENALLREQNALLKSALGMTARVPLPINLTASEERIFGVLMARDVATKEALMIVLYSDDANDWPDPKILDVMICKLRKKLKALEIKIETVWGRGWHMPAESKAVVKGFSERAQAA